MLTTHSLQPIFSLVVGKSSPATLNLLLLESSCAISSSGRWGLRYFLTMRASLAWPSLVAHSDGCGPAGPYWGTAQHSRNSPTSPRGGPGLNGIRLHIPDSAMSDRSLMRSLQHITTLYTTEAARWVIDQRR